MNASELKTQPVPAQAQATRAMPQISKASQPARSAQSPATAAPQQAQQQYSQQLQKGAPPKDIGSKTTKDAAAKGGPGTLASKKKALSKHNIGTVSDLDHDFAAKVGKLLDALVPVVGDQGGLQIDANIPVSAGVFVAVTLIGEASRSKPGVELRADFRLGLMGAADLGLVNAFVKVQGIGYMEAFGDDSAKTLRLLLWGLYQRVRGLSQRAAEFVWSKGRMDLIEKSMDADDYAENGAGLGVTTGIGVREKAGAQPAGVAGGVQVTQGTRWQKGRGGKVEAKTVQAVKTEFTVGPAQVKIEGSLIKVGGKVTDWEIKVGFGGTLPLAQLSLDGKVVEWILTVLSQAARADRLGAALASKNSGRQVGAMVSLLSKDVAARYAGELLNQKMMSKIKSFGGTQIALRGSAVLSKGPSGVTGSFQLMRTQVIEVGGEADMIHVMLENSEAILSFTDISLGKGDL